MVEGEVHVACADALHHDSVHALADACAHEQVVHSLGHGEELHVLLDEQIDLEMEPPLGKVVEEDALIRNHADGPAVSGCEGVGPLAVHLDDVARGEYLAVERDHHAPAARIGFRRDFRSVEDVPGAVRVAGDGIAHRARDHDGLLIPPSVKSSR